MTTQQRARRRFDVAFKPKVVRMIRAEGLAVGQVCRELDRARASQYWTQPTEMGARAFQGFVEDKIKAGGNVNRFLDYAPEGAVVPAPMGWVHVYPRGEERKAINQAFQQLADTLKTKDTDHGNVAIFEPHSNWHDDPGAQRQLELFARSGYGAGQSDAGSAKSAALEAVDDLHASEDVLARALSRDYAARQRVSLVGQKAGSIYDVATIAQVYRDPRFETFRMIFTKGDRVVAQLGVTSRLPASSQVFIGNDDDAYISGVQAAAKSVGADGYFLLHNHPSTDPTPSGADVGLTTNLVSRFSGLQFRGHVVIDTNRFGLIRSDGTTDVIDHDFGQSDPFTADGFLNAVINSPSGAAAFAKRLALDPGQITMVALDRRNAVSRLATLPASIANAPRQRLVMALRRARFGAAGDRAIFVGRDLVTLERLGRFGIDAIHVSSRGQVTSLRNRAMITGAEDPIFPKSRGGRVSPDTSPAFSYLRGHPAAQGTAAVHEGELSAGDQDAVRNLAAQYASTKGAPSEAEIADAVRQFRDTERMLGGRGAYDKALAAGATKLHYPAWVQVRTSNFKRWWGYDWQNSSGAKALGARADTANERGSGGGANAEIVGGRENRSGIAQVPAPHFRDAIFYDFGTGEPRVFFHGTRDDFTAFDIGHPNKKDAGWLGRGHYVSSDRGIAEGYSLLKRGADEPRVMELFVRPIHPRTLVPQDKLRIRRLTADGLTQFNARLKRMGYGGAMVMFDDGRVEIAAFDANALKSATDNLGTFNGSDDTRFDRTDSGNFPVATGKPHDETGIPQGLPATETADSRDLSRIINRDLGRLHLPQGFRATEVGRADLPPALRDALDTFEHATGTRAIVFHNLTPNIADFNGLNVRDGRVFISDQSQHPVTSTAAHEWLHNLRRTNPALYDKLAAEIRRQGRLPEYAERLKKNGETRADNPDVVEEELTAAAVGDAMTDPVFLQRLAAQSKALFQRVARSFLKFLNTLTRTWKTQHSNEYLRDVQAFRDRLKEVIDALDQPGTSGAPDAWAHFMRAWHGTLRFAKEKQGSESRELMQAMRTNDGLPNLASHVLYAEELQAFKSANPDIRFGRRDADDEAAFNRGNANTDQPRTGNFTPPGGEPPMGASNHSDPMADVPLQVVFARRLPLTCTRSRQAAWPPRRSHTSLHSTRSSAR